MSVPMPCIRNLNPADIESLDVLKNAASAAAIYGSRASNGVILLTKKGARLFNSIIPTRQIRVLIRITRITYRVARLA